MKEILVDQSRVDKNNVNLMININEEVPWYYSEQIPQFVGMVGEWIHTLHYEMVMGETLQEILDVRIPELY